MTHGKELKPHIGIFGRRNYGKSSLLNYLTQQTLAIVSNTAGTTTDPVKKTMEISGVGPVVWVDTAGIDDEGTLGQLRVAKSFEVLPQMDLVLLLVSQNRFDHVEQQLIDACNKAAVPYLLIYAKSDLSTPDMSWVTTIEERLQHKIFLFNIHNTALRPLLLSQIRETLPETAYQRRTLLGDLIQQGDVVVMVTPIDSSAPQGRMILPQMQVLRDILDHNAKAVVCRESELQQTLLDLKQPPRMVVTDSQVFGIVSQIVPTEVPLTSFSILLAQSKGLFDAYCQGTLAIGNLKDGDRILLLESCTHNVTCEDIGRVKLPRLLQQRTNKQLYFDTVSGFTTPPHPLTDYAIVIQCGCCVVTPKQLAARLAPAIEAGVPVSNYGLALAYLNGIFTRSVAVFLKQQRH